MAPHILIIAPESSLRSNLCQHLHQEGFTLSETDGSQDLISILGAGRFNLILLDLEGLKRSGIALMRIIRERYPQIKIITINSGDQLDLSIESMRLGAYDDFLIPFDLDGLMECIRGTVDAPEKKRKPDG